MLHLISFYRRAGRADGGGQSQRPKRWRFHGPSLDLLIAEIVDVAGARLPSPHLISSRQSAGPRLATAAKLNTQAISTHNAFMVGCKFDIAVLAVFADPASRV
jgi:hypothetical protein